MANSMTFTAWSLKKPDGTLNLDPDQASLPGAPVLLPDQFSVTELDEYTPESTPVEVSVTVSY